MHSTSRKLFPYAVLTILVGLTCWALWFDPPPPADFTFNNATEIKSVDPARVTGAPEGRIIRMLFEGLFRPDPETLEPRPAMAVSSDPAEILSKDGRNYTFTIRDDAIWTDGSPVTAHDFQWSWQRFLHPETGSQYQFILFYVVGAQKYSQPSLLEPGDAVEVELYKREKPEQLFPRGTILKGRLDAVEKPPEPEFEEGTPASEREKSERERKMEKWEEQWVYVVNVEGRQRRFCKAEKLPEGVKDVERCRHVLFDFDQVGIKALDDHRLQVQLNSRTPYFLYLMQFYPAFPVNRKCIETHGYPAWTRAENIVGNGPFTLKYRHIRDRIRMVKNDQYWDADNVKLNVVDALAVSSSTTALNMYLDNQIDWVMSPPSAVIQRLQERNDYIARATLTIDFYRFNVTRPPFNLKEKRTVDGREVVIDRGKLVRQALNQSINKEEICSKILRAGQQPARSIVPPGLVGYEPGQSGDYDVERARVLLAEAGFEGGRGCPTIEVLFNSSQGHKQIAEAIAEQWEKNLGIKVVPRQLEWGTFLSTTRKLDYMIARAGWIGDYPDPNTFLDLFITDGAQNETGWSNVEYDKLIKGAESEEDPKKRLAMLHDAEAILMDELPVIPIYWHVNVNLVKPFVKGFYPNAQDMHPVLDLSIDKQQRDEYLRTQGNP